MKKTLLFALGLMMGLPSMAQTEVDVTNYIVNPGFDEDISFNANGTAAKELTNTGRIADKRGLVYEAADGSLYTLCNDNKGYNAAGELSWYGFITHIKGWEATNTTNAPAWVYFGSVPLDVQEGMLAVGDGNPAGSITMPALPDELKTPDNKAALYFRAGWQGACSYKQVVELPCAEYRLEYWSINANANSTATPTNLSNVTCRKDVFKDDEGLAAKEWTKHTIEFTPTSEFTIEFGYKAAQANSNANPWVFIDGIKLYKIGDADPVKILQSDLLGLQSDIELLSSEADSWGYTGLKNEIEDYSMELDDVILLKDQAQLEAALKNAQAKYKYFQEAIAQLTEIDKMIDKIDKLIQSTDFPGRPTLEAFLGKLDNYKNTGNAETLMGAIEEAEAAILSYYMSQQASEATPADFTLFVKNPWFITPEKEPEFDEGNYIYTNGLSNDDLTSDGWYRGSFTEGDQRTNNAQGRSCWNAWASNFTQTVSINQDLTSLPNGYYKVSADMITQSGYITNQHVYAKSAAKKAESPVLTYDTWNDTNDGAWETLTTTEKVLVSDGKLTIGAEGTGNGQASAGWFCATNFKLYYLGEATAEDLQNAFNDKLAKVSELAATMHFAADRKNLQDTINAYSSATDLNTAMAALSAAEDEASKSEALYEEYMMEGKTLPTVKAGLEDGTYKQAADIVQFAYDYVNSWMVSDTATYTMLDAMVTLLKNYVNTYAPVCNEVAELAENGSEVVKNYLQSLLAEQKAKLTAEMQNAETVQAMVDALNEVAAQAKKQALVEDASTTDYTSFIMNPNAEAQTGWTMEKGNGDGPIKSAGQWMDDSKTAYFDSWNGSGLQGYKVSQLVKDLPNGTYTLGVYARTPAEGAYVFYQAAADTTFVEIPMQYYTTINEETGEEEQAVASDHGGAIWEDAKEKMENGLIAEDDPNYAFVQAVYNANAGKGRGWQQLLMENIVVTNHELLIGTCTGTEASATEKVFAGNWYSVGGWTLTINQLGDNSDWVGPFAAGINETVAEQSKAADGIYNLNGQRIARTQRGLNIVVTGGKARKYIVK